MNQWALLMVVLVSAAVAITLRYLRLVVFFRSRVFYLWDLAFSSEVRDGKRYGFMFVNTSGDTGFYIVMTNKEEDFMKTKWQPSPQVALKQAMAKMAWQEKAQMMLSAMAADLGVEIVAGLTNHHEKGYFSFVSQARSKEEAAALLRIVAGQLLSDADKLEGKTPTTEAFAVPPEEKP